MWLLYNRKMQATHELKKRVGKVVVHVPFAGNRRLLTTFFFFCPLANYVWNCIHIILNWRRTPRLVEDIFSIDDVMKSHIPQSLHLFLFASIVWALWRNWTRCQSKKVSRQCYCDHVWCNFFYAKVGVVDQEGGFQQDEEHLGADEGLDPWVPPASWESFGYCISLMDRVGLILAWGSS